LIVKFDLEKPDYWHIIRLILSLVGQIYVVNGRAMGRRPKTQMIMTLDPEFIETIHQELHTTLIGVAGRDVVWWRCKV
jgi:hypothetical protein